MANCETGSSNIDGRQITYPPTATIDAGQVWVMNARFNELIYSNAVPAKQFAMQENLNVG